MARLREFLKDIIYIILSVIVIGLLLYTLVSTKVPFSVFSARTNFTEEYTRHLKAVENKKVLDNDLDKLKSLKQDVLKYSIDNKRVVNKKIDLIDHFYVGAAKNNCNIESIHEIYLDKSGNTVVAKSNDEVDTAGLESTDLLEVVVNSSDVDSVVGFIRYIEKVNLEYTFFNFYLDSNEVEVTNFEGEPETVTKTKYYYVFRIGGVEN